MGFGLCGTFFMAGGRLALEFSVSVTSAISLVLPSASAAYHRYFTTDGQCHFVLGPLNSCARYLL